MERVANMPSYTGQPGIASLGNLLEAHVARIVVRRGWKNGWGRD